MRYMSRNHTSRTATVWCPGPVAYSVWALDDETRRPVVIRLKYGKVENACEVTNWSHPSHEHEDGRSCSDDGCVRYLAWPMRDHVTRKGYRYAPKLPEKVWRAAVGDQCTQLALDDAAVFA